MSGASCYCGWGIPDGTRDDLEQHMQETHGAPAFDVTSEVSTDGVQFHCDECGKVGYHKPGCAVEARRLAMQMQLERVNIDPAKLKERNTPRRTVEVIAHDVRRKLLERAELLLDYNDLDNAVTLINAAKGLV